MEIIHKYSDEIKLVISEKDSGPADALNKGFAKATGEIMGWLNTDDRLHANSLKAAAEIFDTFNNVSWIMGFPTWYSSSGFCINEIYYNYGKIYQSPGYISDNLHLKFARWSKWRFAMGDFSAIQQESVFWRRSLWQMSGAKLNQDLISFDLDLWTRFFEHADLYTTNVLIGGFRIHGDQISFNQRNRYTGEAKEKIEKFRSVLYKKHNTYRIRTLLARMMKPFYYYEVPILKHTYPKLLELPPYIAYDVHREKFFMKQF
jgi:glycosyltransferase involved in cell wall biosynthesis